MKRRKQRFERPVHEIHEERRIEVRRNTPAVSDPELQPRGHSLRLHDDRLGSEDIPRRGSRDDLDELLCQTLEFVAGVESETHGTTLLEF